MFEERLLGILDNFDLKVAEALSISIHEAEKAGYEITDEENKLWLKLTDKIIIHRPISSYCCCEGKDWNCSDLPECVDQEEWNSLYLIPRCSK